MDIGMTALTTTPAWTALAAHHERINDVHLRQLFAEDPGRAEPKLSHDSCPNALITRYRARRA